MIEKPDVIGAIFGQTEGLLGSDLDLRELQRTGRIGRIEVNIKSNQGNSEGEIIIPSSLDSAETALIAATLETIERIGPCIATVKLENVEDMRSEKRKYVVEKAKEILKNLVEAGVPSAAEISEQIKEAVRTHEVTSYHGLPAGPNITDSDNIIVVEGRADVVNLLKYGIRNVIAIEGTSVPPVISDLSREKVVTLFVDGDRGGQLILKEVLQLADIDYVATAPQGKEVEELTKKEVYKALREKVSAEQFKMELRPDLERNGRFDVSEYQPQAEQKVESFEQRQRTQGRREQKPKVEITPEQRELFSKTLEELVGTRAACIFDSENQVLGKVPVSELMEALKTVESPYAIVFDGKVDFRLNSMAKRKGVKILVGMEKERFSTSLLVMDRKDMEIVATKNAEENKA
ncbi:MAG: DNA primase DnaG [Candidatus Aenigmatarchaeota archaeon]